MTVRVRLFGPQARLAGRRELAVEVPGSQATCAAVRAALAEADAGLAPSLASSRLAVNYHFASDGDPVRPDDEVALIGLISGG